MERGFTIIEVMLFFAISGLLFAMLMVGANTGISQQRYLDSVRSYKAFLQNQYAEVLNTQNDRDNTLKCGVNGASTGTGTAPGADTDCVVLGRVIRIKDNGMTLSAANVTGYVDPAMASSDRSDDLLAYKPHEVTNQTDTWEMDWGSQLRINETQDFDSNATAPAILIVRSPASGLVRVFTATNNTTTDLSAMVDPGNAATYEQKLCHYIDGNSGNLPKQWVIVNPSVASADGVSTNEQGCS